MYNNTARVLISCRDRKGLSAAVTSFISENRGNIVHLDQHVDFEQNTFFLRAEWELNEFRLSREELPGAIADFARAYEMEWSLHLSDDRTRTAVFVSKQAHCLYDILSRHEAGELRMEIPLIVSNHEDLAEVARRFDIPFFVFPVTAENKRKQEQAELELLHAHDIQLIVLARYMQIVSPLLISHYRNRIINIHHSFLPAFPGARPYHSAHKRGVKIIGATSHYVTEELDAGPIIEQDVIHVSHQDSVQDFIRRGRDLEKIVLARAIWRHLEHRIIVYNDKTVTF